MVATRRARLDPARERVTTRVAGNAPAAAPAPSARSLRHNRRVGRQIGASFQAVLSQAFGLGERATHPSRDYDASTTDAAVGGRRPSALDRHEAAAFLPDAAEGAVETAAAIGTAWSAVFAAREPEPEPEGGRDGRDGRDRLPNDAEFSDSPPGAHESLFGAQIALERVSVSVPKHLASLGLSEPMTSRFRMPPGESSPAPGVETTVVVRPGPEMSEGDGDREAWTVWMWKLVTALGLEDCTWRTLRMLHAGQVPDNVVVTPRPSAGGRTPILVTAFLVDKTVETMYPTDITHWYWNHQRVLHMSAVHAQLRSSVFSKLTSAIVDIEDVPGITDAHVKALYDAAKNCFDVVSQP